MLPPNLISGPRSTLAAVDAPITITFAGLDLADGDYAKWVDVDDDCGGMTAALSAVSGNIGTFTFTSPGLKQLCYKWNFFGSEYEPSAFLIFPDVQAVALKCSLGVNY